MTRYYVKIPGPGEFRGEGEWVECELEEYEHFLETGYLPVMEEDDDS